MIGAPVFAEADLHAFVDGMLEPERRSDFLRRLAGSPADRARIDAWQEQNDLIRLSFFDVERESLPPVLDLVPPASINRAMDTASPTRPGRIAASLATVLLIAAGIGSVWMLLPQDEKDPVVAADAPLRGTLDAALATRTAQLLAGDVRETVARGATSEGLPPAAIPDLSGSGFALTRAESDATIPASLVLHYENAKADRLVMSIARTTGAVSTPPTRVGQSLSWRHRDKSFALSGTVKQDRLLDIAMSLQDPASDN